MPADVQKIVFPVSIYDAESRSQNFGQVRNAFIRVVNAANNSEIARYDLSEDASTETAMVFGELYRNGAEWKFRAVGQGYASGLAGIAKDYGVNVWLSRRPRRASDLLTAGRAPASRPAALSRSHSQHATRQDLPHPRSASRSSRSSPSRSLAGRGRR